MGSDLTDLLDIEASLCQKELSHGIGNDDIASKNGEPTNCLYVRAIQGVAKLDRDTKTRGITGQERLQLSDRGPREVSDTENQGADAVAEEVLVMEPPLRFFPRPYQGN